MYRKILLIIAAIFSWSISYAADALVLPEKAKEVFTFKEKVEMNGKPYKFKDYNGNNAKPKFNEANGYMIPSGEYLRDDHSRERYPNQSIVIRGHFTKYDLITRHSSKHNIGGHAPFKIKKGEIHGMYSLPEDKELKRGHRFNSEMPDSELATIVIVYEADTCRMAYGKEIVKFIDPASLDKEMEFITIGYADKEDYITDLAFYDRALTVKEMEQTVGSDNYKYIDINNYNYGEDDTVKKYIIYLAIGLILTIIYLIRTKRWWKEFGVGLYPMWAVVWGVIAMIIVFSMMFHGPMIRIQCTSAGIALLFYILMCITPYKYKSEEERQKRKTARTNVIVSIITTFIDSLFKAIAGAFNAVSDSQQIEKTYVNGELKKTEKSMDMGSFAGKLIFAFIKLVFPIVLAVMALWLVGNILMNIVYFIPFVQFFLGLDKWSKVRKGEPDDD